MNEFIIEDPDTYSGGGSAEFFYLKNSKDLGFKQFKNKDWAIDAHKRQDKLSKLDLAPKIYSDITRLKNTGWGFVTERAVVFDEEIMLKRLKQIQQLVNTIYLKTGWKFWDCHYYNVGYVIRKKGDILVCIDTGKESFSAIGNAWGNPDPGPKCSYCNKYNCRCVD